MKNHRWTGYNDGDSLIPKNSSSHIQIRGNGTHQDHPPIHPMYGEAIPSNNLTQELNDYSSNNTISDGARDHDYEDSSVLAMLYKISMQLSDIQRKNMTFEQRVESYLENISRDYISLKTTIPKLKSAINEVRRNQILVLNTVQNKAGRFRRGIMDVTMRDDLNSEVNYHENTIASSSNFWQMPSGRDSSGGTDPCCSNEPSGTNLLSLIDGHGLRNDMESNDQVYGSSTRATSNVENSRSTVTQQCFSRFIKEEIDDRPGDTEISQIHQSLLIPHSSTISDTSSGSGVDIKDVITRAMPTDLPKPRTYQYFDHDCNELRMTDEWKEYALSLYPVQPKRFWNIAPSDFDRLIPDEILENGEETKRELIKSIREWFYSQYRIAQLHFVLKENPNYVNKDLTWIWQAYKQTMEKKNWPIYGTELLPNEVSSAELQLNEPFFY